MGALGDSNVAIWLFEAQIVPALLFNSESWVDLTHLSDLQNFQDKFLRKLLRMPPTTAKSLLHWDGGDRNNKMENSQEEDNVHKKNINERC